MAFCISPRTPSVETSPNNLRGGFMASQRVTTPRSKMTRQASFGPRRTNTPAEISTPRSIPRPKVHATPASERNIYVRRRSQSLVVAVASTESKVSKSGGVGTPHEPSSPEGKLLSMILQKENHFFEFAVSEQLDELVSARDQAVELINQTPGNSMQSILQRRIAEVKEKECQTAVEDVMYMSIVHKFLELELPMVPKLSECVSNNTLELWPSKCRELESIHSLEIQEMVREHVMNILRMKGKFNSMNGETTTKMDKVHIGRLYASSIMYGYFLKAACFRRQLESSIAITPAALQSVCHGARSSFTESYSGGFTGVGSLGHLMNSTCLESPRLEKLSSYVKTLDSDSLQKCAKLKSKEAINLIEKHTWGLFGDENIGDDSMDVTFASLERLVFEAVAFGSFLWDVESSVDSVYGLKKN